jgi:anti-sigma-K factor RskA
MEDELIHELSAAYALDALDPDEERAFEQHLASCPRCREDVARFTETGASLAFAVPAGEPPSALRERILAEARAERENVVTLRPRWSYAVAAVAAVAVFAAIGLGVWAASLHSQLSGTEALQALPLQGARGSVVVGKDGRAAIVVSGLAPAPTGRTYQLWVIRGTDAQPAGLFAANAQTSTVPLSRPVENGDRVGVTLEPAGGSARPTSAPLVTSAAA